MGSRDAWPAVAVVANVEDAVTKRRVILAAGVAAVLFAGWSAFSWLAEPPHHAAWRQIKLGDTESEVAAVID
jgi:hypothetical protein